MSLPQERSRSRLAEVEERSVAFFLGSASAIYVHVCGDTHAIRFDSIRKTKAEPQIKQEYPLNLSILVSGGKETNEDSSSNGE